MDISAINKDLPAYLSAAGRNGAALDGFRAVFDRALENSAAADNRELREACEMFESYFLQLMFREMRKTSFNENGYLPKSHAERIFTDLLDEEISKSAARSGGIGLAEQLYRQMTRYGTE